MAEDKLMFPIGFNLDEGVKKAGNEWANGKANQLSKLLKKTPVDVKLKFDITDNNALDKVKQRLKGLKLEPITPETKQAIRDLARELQTLAKALEKIQKINATNASASSPDAVRAARINEINQRSAARVATEHERARAAAARAEAAELRLAQARQRSLGSIRSQSAEYGNQLGYIDRLIRRMAVLWSISAATNFVSKLREVTAEFELQRVSLGAIIQDQSRANQLFSEIKTFALQSPLTIMDLTKYTKQLAAYKIGVEDLFDTTKRLADVSVGLGVSFDRIVLAYGQIRAAGALRASEIRQLTEAGIPIVEALSEKLSEVNGKLVSASDVMGMVEKRMISFEQVKEIFEDMTSAGGMFYNMQEKQSQTLFGMWSKLGDAAAVMYDEMGNVGWVNDAMKSFIGTLESMLRNWRLLAGEIGIVGAYMVSYAIKQKNAALQANAMAVAQNKVRAAGMAYNALLKQQAALEATATAAQRQSIAAKIANAKATLDLAIAERKAAQSVTIFGKAWKSVKSFFVGNWVGLLVTALSAVAMYFLDANEKANRLNKTLDDIFAGNIKEYTKSVRNFEFLAKKAVEAADGSKEQKDALDELHRTYKDMIPVQDMTIEKLRALKGNYNQLTEAVKEYISEQSRQKAISSSSEIYGKEQQDRIKNIREYLLDKGMSDVEVQRFFVAFEKQADITSKSVFEKFKTAMEQAGVEVSKVLGDESASYLTKRFDTDQFYGLYYNVRKLSEANTGYLNTMEAINKAYAEESGLTGEARKEFEKLQKALGDVQKRYQDAKGKDTFLTGQDYSNQRILLMVDNLKKALKAAGVEIKAEWFSIIEDISKSPEKLSEIDFAEILKNVPLGFKSYIKQVQNLYDGFVIKDTTINGIRNGFLKLAKQMKVSIDDERFQLMNSGENYEAYRKRIKGVIDDLISKINALTAARMAMAQWTPEYAAKKSEEEQLQKLKEFYEKFYAALPGQTTGGGRSGAGSDTRLQTLSEIEKSLTEINKKYDELSKKEGATKALEHTNELYDKQLKYLNQIARRFGLEFKMPTDFSDLQKYREQILKVIEKLKSSGLKGAEKAAIDLGMTISTGNIDKLQKNVEQQLKELQDRVSRTKTAKEFYDRILNLTGDYEMSAEITMSVYGDTGETLQKDMADHLRKMFGSFEVEVPVEIIGDDNKIDYSALDAYIKKADELQERLNKTTDESERKELQAQIVPERQLSELKKINDDYKKNSAEQWQLWLKDLEKAKSYSDKRIDLARYTAKQIADIDEKRIEAQKKLTELQESGAEDEKTKAEINQLKGLLEQYKQMQEGYKVRETKMTEQLGFEAFKEMPLYVQMFENLDNASTKMLTTMRDKLIAMRGEWKNLSPKELKEMQARLREIDSQLARRNPFKVLTNAFKEYKQLSKDGSRKDALNDLKEKTEAYTEAQKNLENAIKEFGEDSTQAQDAKKLVDDTEDAAAKAQELADKWKAVEDAIGLSANEVFAIMDSFSDVAKGIADVTEAFGGSEEDVQYWNDMADGIGKVTGGIQDILKSVLQGNIVGIVTNTLTAIPKMIVGFTEIFSAGKIKRANKEIKRQQEILDQLTYTYQRLQKAQESALGNQYISNYNQQLKNLQAQAKAYQKQADAERSKGKKKDEEKIKQFEEAYRSTMDEIKDMQQDLVNYFAGTDITSAARDFAKAWLDAKVSFEDTTEAMREKFADLIQNMIVEAMAAEVMKRALEPFYDALDTATKDGTFDINELVKAAEVAYNSIGTANNAMEVLFNTLEAKGLDMQKIFGEADTQLTGISRDIATASEESINGLAQGITTQNFYISQIHANVAMIAQVMMQGYTPAITAGEISLTDLVTMQNKHLSNLPQIANNTAEMVAECRRAANTCETIATQLGRVISPKGSTTAHTLKTSIS